jgi:hypothetical protein
MVRWLERREEVGREAGTMKQNAKILIVAAGLMAAVLYSCGGGYGSSNGYGMAAAAPGMFTLSAPADGAMTTGPTPLLTWAPAPNTSDYRVQIDTAGTFTGTLVVNAVENATTYSYQVSAATVTVGTLYHWRVIAENVYGQSIAGPRSFTP